MKGLSYQHGKRPEIGDNCLQYTTLESWDHFFELQPQAIICYLNNCSDSDMILCFINEYEQATPHILEYKY